MSMPVPVQPDISDDDVAAAQPAPEPLESQRLFELHDANMQRVEELYGKALDAMDGAELLALQSAIINRLEVTTDEQLSGAVTGQDAALSLADVGRIAEENHRRFYNFQCRLAFLLEGWFESIDARSATLAHKVSVRSRIPKISLLDSSASIIRKWNVGCVLPRRIPQNRGFQNAGT